MNTTHTAHPETSASISRLEKTTTTHGVIPKLYRISDVMVQLGISRATVYRMVAAGKLRLVKVGETGSRITAESIDALISGGATQ